MTQSHVKILYDPVTKELDTVQINLTPDYLEEVLTALSAGLESYPFNQPGGKLERAEKLQAGLAYILIHKQLPPGPLKA